MTGGSASINSDWGGEFEAWNGYIHGKNLELEPGKRIVQSWRTSEFNADEPDSRIEITLEAVGDHDEAHITAHGSSTAWNAV